jgi:peptidoglycan/LPS O-acetylase OafA/YrhL
VLKSAWMRDPRFDFPVLSVGCLVTAGLSVGLATALLEVSRTTTGPNVGPTAATLNDAVYTLAGAALGLAAGSGVVARFVRRGSRVTAGLIAGFFAYGAVLIPVIVAARPSDESGGDALETALLVGVPLGLVVIIASLAGARLGTRRATKMTRRRRRARSGSTSP